MQGSAEGVGFEPTNRLSPVNAFECAASDLQLQALLDDWIPAHAARISYPEPTLGGTLKFTPAVPVPSTSPEDRVGEAELVRRSDDAHR